MPIPLEDAVDAQAAAAAGKAEMLKRRPLQYLVQSLLAGAYVGVAVVLLIMISASFVKSGSVATKLVQGSVFGVALTLVVFAGAELFTGVVMTMIQGVMARTVKILDLLAVWVAALIGNFIGAAIFSALVAASGIITVGGTKKEAAVYFTALAGVLKAKGALTGAQLFWRAVLCNFLVCLGLWMAARASSDSAKLICLFWSLLAFVASGFEHSVANMTFFFLGVFVHTPHGTVDALLHNLTYTVPGNIVGGGLMVAAAYSFSAGGVVRPESGQPGWMTGSAVPAQGAAAGVEALSSAPAPVTARAVIEPAPPSRRTSGRRAARSTADDRTIDLSGRGAQTAGGPEPEDGAEPAAAPTRRRTTPPPQAGAPTATVGPGKAVPGRARGERNAAVLRGEQG